MEQYIRFFPAVFAFDNKDNKELVNQYFRLPDVYSDYFEHYVLSTFIQVKSVLGEIKEFPIDDYSHEIKYFNELLHASKNLKAIDLEYILEEEAYYYYDNVGADVLNKLFDKYEVIEDKRLASKFVLIYQAEYREYFEDLIEELHQNLELAKIKFGSRQDKKPTKKVPKYSVGFESTFTPKELIIIFESLNLSGAIIPNSTHIRNKLVELTNYKDYQFRDALKFPMKLKDKESFNQKLNRLLAKINEFT